MSVPPDEGSAAEGSAAEQQRRAVDAAWADIVAHWEGEVPSADDPPEGDRGRGHEGGAAGDGSQDGARANDGAGSNHGAGPAGGEADRGEGVADGSPLVGAATGAPAGPRDHAPREEEPEGWVPPDPPPLPRGPVSAWLPWAAVLGGPLLALVAALLRPAHDDLLFAIASAAFVGGFVVLVARLPSRRDGDDDGARV